MTVASHAVDDDDAPREGRSQVDRETLARWARAYLPHAPISLCLRELNRLLAIETVEGAGRAPLSPVLDVGCGDGFWWTQRARPGREVYGIDISAREVARAATRIHAAVSDVSRERPFPGLRFRQIVGNCSLEHVRDIDAALRNLRACAAPGAQLVLFVPAAQWAFQGLLQRFLLGRSRRLAMTISGALNGFFQHWHLYEVPVWRRLLEHNGWRVVETHGLGNARSEFLFRLFLPPALGSFLVKSAVGAYPSRLLGLLPDAALAPLGRLLTWALSDPLIDAGSPHAYEYMLVAECADAR